jgi:hypothetical protein
MNLSSFMNRARLILGACIAAAAVSAAAGPRDDEIAAVSVYKQVLTQQVVYTYTVTNKGDRPITALSVGFDFYRGVADLSGTVPTQLGSPAGWSARGITVEESDAYELRWENPQAPIEPGQTVSGFSVTVPAEDARFVQSHWTVLVDGPPVHASSVLQPSAAPVDTIPPVVQVTLSPTALWPPNGKLVTVQASVTATDNLDGPVQASLVSVTCNECADPAADIVGVDIGGGSQEFMVRAARLGKRKEGRVYTVTYKATDQAGNTGTGSATVTLPHDRRN